MQADYALFVASAYGMAALVLGGLVAFTMRDARRVKARLAELEASGERARPGTARP